LASLQERLQSIQQVKIETENKLSQTTTKLKEERERYTKLNNEFQVVLNQCAALQEQYVLSSTQVTELSMVLNQMTEYLEECKTIITPLLNVQEIQTLPTEELPSSTVFISKNVGKAKVDRYCTLGPGTSVYEDYDCILNQTNLICNNSKFYVIQLLEQRGNYYVFTRWGRVGEPGRSAVKSWNALESAIKEFNKKFTEKTKNQWGCPFTPVPGKYTRLEIQYGDSDADNAEMASLRGGPVSIQMKPSLLDSVTQQFISLIFNEDMFKEQMIRMDLDIAQISPGSLLKTHIEAGYNILKAIKNSLNAGNQQQVAVLSSQFYSIFPHAFPMHLSVPPLNFIEVIEQKTDMLHVLSNIEFAQSLQRTVMEKPFDGSNPIDDRYLSLHAELFLVDNDSEEFKMVETYATNTQSPHRRCKIINLWRVEREGDCFKEHDGIGNRKLLWYGTSVSRVASILSSGLPVASGGRAGSGIYFASENGKSAAYVRCYQGTGVMFLGEAILGREHHIYLDDFSLVAPPPGYDSVVAKGRIENDPAGNVEILLYGNTVVVPTGKPVQQTGPAANSTFMNSEYMVYKESQAAVRYVMTVTLG